MCWMWHKLKSLYNSPVKCFQLLFTDEVQGHTGTKWQLGSETFHLSSFLYSRHYPSPRPQHFISNIQHDKCYPTHLPALPIYNAHIQMNLLPTLFSPIPILSDWLWWLPDTGKFQTPQPSLRILHKRCISLSLTFFPRCTFSCAPSIMLHPFPWSPLKIPVLGTLLPPQHLKYHGWHFLLVSIGFLFEDWRHSHHFFPVSNIIALCYIILFLVCSSLIVRAWISFFSPPPSLLSFTELLKFIVFCQIWRIFSHIFQNIF